MAMPQVLPKIVRTVKRFGQVALPKLVHIPEVPDLLFPVLLSGVPRYNTHARTTDPDGRAAS